MLPQKLLYILTVTLLFLESMAFRSPSDIPSISAEQLRNEWNRKSKDYYSKIMREQRRKNMGQVTCIETDEDFVLAQKHYFALRKIKEGKNRHAEIIYRRIINEIMSEEQRGDCDHAKLAVTTLLLALHCQRMGDLKKTRSVFLNFFRVVIVENEESLTECACSAKVLGAYALFEMKQGNKIKSLEIAEKAVQLDDELGPVLSWKQFRDVKQEKSKGQFKDF